MVQILLVVIGHFQEYILDNIRHLRRLGFDRITVLTEPAMLSYFRPFPDLHLIDASALTGLGFDAKTKMCPDFRGGFWRLAAKRLFLVYEYIRGCDARGCIHLENDVLLYATPAELAAFAFDREKVYVTMDHANRCIPGIVYIPNHRALSNLFDDYDYAQSDMVNLARFYNRNRERCEAFPIIKRNRCYPNLDMYSKNFEQFRGVFDAAAIGQYVGGVDPRNGPGGGAAAAEPRERSSRGFVNETCVVDYSRYRFCSRKRGALYFPHARIGGEWVPVFALHVHSKRVREFAVDSPAQARELADAPPPFLVTGEQIQFACDHAVGRARDFRFNPRVRRQRGRWRQQSRLLDVARAWGPIANGRVVFCYTHLLAEQELLVSRLARLQNRFVLVFHNSDHNFAPEHLELFRRLGKLDGVYAQNMNVVDERVRPLPIGLANRQWYNGDLTLFRRVCERARATAKDCGVFFNFSIRTNPSERSACYRALRKKGVAWCASRGLEQYWTALSRHRYCICPVGNGIDTHRFWECVYLGVVPVCRRNHLVEYYAKYFPVVLLDAWDDFDELRLVATPGRGGALAHTCARDFLWKMASAGRVPPPGAAAPCQFDVVIPVGPNDAAVVRDQIAHTRRNVVGHRNVYLVSRHPARLQIAGCIAVDENLFPFSMRTVEKHHGASPRTGWYLQQLLKLYAGLMIPGILDRYLVVDADTFFMRPTRFVEAVGGRCLYNYGAEHHRPYFDHMRRLHDSLRRFDPAKSGICHHMMFETANIRELFAWIEGQDARGRSFYDIFLAHVDAAHYLTSGASEYELYFNYMLLRHPDAIRLRPLRWANRARGAAAGASARAAARAAAGYDYVSFHYY